MSKTCALNVRVASGAAAATTAVLINRQGTPLNGAIYWAIQAGFGGGKYAAKIASQGCALQHLPLTKELRTSPQCLHLSECSLTGILTQVA